jgi:DNA-binding FadR family transcriptional regulator
METRAAASGTRLADLTLDQQNALWDAIKRDDAEAAGRAIRTEAP